MKWIDKKIINKSKKLPWLEIIAEKNNILPGNEPKTFISEIPGEINTQLKSSLDDVLAIYEQTIGYHENDPREISVKTGEKANDQNSQPRANLQTLDEFTNGFTHLNGFESENAESRPLTQKKIPNYHYKTFNTNIFKEKQAAAIAKYNFSHTPANSPFVSQTLAKPEKYNPIEKNIEYDDHNHKFFDEKNKFNPDDTNEIKSQELSDNPAGQKIHTMENDNENNVENIGEPICKPDQEHSGIQSQNENTKENPEYEDFSENIRFKGEKDNLFDITISRQNILPSCDESFLNPLTAQSYFPDDYFESAENNEEIHDNVNDADEDYETMKSSEMEDDTDTEDSTEYEAHAEESDSAQMAGDSSESNNPSFRCSVTPEIKTNNQFHIPFNVLRTGNDEYDHSDPVEVQQIIEKLESTLDQFGIEARVIGMQRGPIITRYEIRIPPGIKVNRILSLTDELAMALEALRVRIEAPIPGRSTVGIEIPNKKRSTVLLGDIINHPEYDGNSVRLPLPLGKDIAGNLLIEDLCKMPHILIAGATGSGKSVAINAFITSMIITKSPEEVRMLMVDPKLVELSQYNDIPHLLHPVISDAQKAILALNWAVEEMDRRYEDMADMRARDIISYNLKVDQHNKIKSRNEEAIPKMPYIVILIDELGDLMMVAGKEVESSIIRLSQKARAIGIHLILATQRPSVDVITALIKANCPARIALQVAQKTDSRTILDSNGGEQLLGQGDMLFKHPSRAQLIRAQAPYVSDQEVENVVNMVKKFGKPSYIMLEDPKAKTGELEMEDENLFDEAWGIIVESNKASASYLQRRLRIGYNRAARIIEAFEARGYIGPQVGSKPREIYIHNN